MGKAIADGIINSNVNIAYNRRETDYFKVAILFAI